MLQPFYTSKPVRLNVEMDTKSEAKLIKWGFVEIKFKEGEVTIKQGDNDESKPIAELGFDDLWPIQSVLKVLIETKEIADGTTTLANYESAIKNLNKPLTNLIPGLKRFSGGTKINEHDLKMIFGLADWYMPWRTTQGLGVDYDSITGKVITFWGKKSTPLESPHLKGHFIIDVVNTTVNTQELCLAWIEKSPYIFFSCRIENGILQNVRGIKVAPNSTKTFSTLPEISPAPTNEAYIELERIVRVVKFLQTAETDASYDYSELDLS
jgi:hypothetical protein